MESDPDNLDERLRTYYRSRTLSPAIASRVKDAIRHPVAASKRSIPRRLTRLVAVAAVCSLLAAVGIAALLVLMLSQGPREDVRRLAAQEVAANHHKQLAVEFMVGDISDLARQMEKLDFTPVMPERFREGGHRIIGARYCSVRGQIAAQIRLTDAGGRACTLYEARPADELSEVTSAEFNIDGCRVAVWREAGLLMVLAGPAHQ